MQEWRRPPLSRAINGVNLSSTLLRQPVLWQPMSRSLAIGKAATRKPLMNSDAPKMEEKKGKDRNCTKGWQRHPIREAALVRATRQQP